MTFENIYWLYAFIPVLFLLLLGFNYSQKTRRRFFESLVAPKLQANLMSTYSPKRYLAKSILFVLSIFFLFLALARPQWGYRLQEQKSKGIDILFALDVSKSMLAEDIRPNRLERAKYSVLDLIKKLDGDRFGLIAFAGSAFLQCPLTLDYNAFIESLEQTDPSVIYQGGTDIGTAIRTAEPVFAKENNFKILILITDGEDLEESGITAAKNAAKNDIKIYTVGVGTLQGELIPIKNKDDSLDYLRDSKGKIVKTSLDETTLRKIAEVTGGFYVPLGPKGEGLDQIYYSKLNNIPKQELSSNFKKIPLEQFQWPLGIAILLLSIETLLSTRRKSNRKRFKVYSNQAAAFIITILILGLSSKQLDAGVSRAYKAYQNGEFNKSATLYDKAQKNDPENSPLNYNLGSSLYKDGDYNSAINAFKNTLKTQDLELQQKTFYNLGNTHFRSGELSLQTNPKQSIELWEESLKDYQNALELDSQDLKCQENLDFVKRKLDELKQQQQHDHQQNQQQQQNQKQQQNEDQNNSESESKENPNSDNQDNKESSNKDKNPETPPNTASKEQAQDKQQSKEKQSGDENTQHNKEDSDSKPSTENEPEQQPHRRMNKEEANSLLKTLQNSEKKLPAVSSKQPAADNHSQTFKDW